MKVKLFRVYSVDVSTDYGEAYREIPLAFGVTDWEEIDENEFYNLQQAVRHFNAHDKNDNSYKLVAIRDHGVSAAKTLKNFQKYLQDEKEKTEKAEAARKETARVLKEEKARKKQERLAEKLKMEKLSKEQLFEQLKQELNK